MTDRVQICILSDVTSFQKSSLMALLPTAPSMPFIGVCHHLTCHTAISLSICVPISYDSA